MTPVFFFFFRSFTSVYDPQQADDQVEVANMSTALTMALIQPVEMEEPELEPVKLLLAKEEAVVKSPSTLHYVFASESDHDSISTTNEPPPSSALQTPAAVTHC